MECQEGSQTKLSEHTVKTLEKVKEWFEGSRQFDLPIRVIQHTAGNGRCMIKILDNTGKLIHQRG